jgi:hypothetical protein
LPQTHGTALKNNNPEALIFRKPTKSDKIVFIKARMNFFLARDMPLGETPVSVLEASLEDYFITPATVI